MKILAYAILLVLCSVMVSAEWVFNDNGISLTVINASAAEVAYPASNFYDANFSTYCQDKADDGFLLFFINYTNASNATWQVRDGLGFSNLSVPNTCNNDAIIKFRVNISDDAPEADLVSWDCWNGSAWQVLRSSNNRQAYEEGLWSFSTPSTSCSDVADAWAPFAILVAVMVAMLMGFGLNKSEQGKKMMSMVLWLSALLVVASMGLAWLSSLGTAC